MCAERQSTFTAASSKFELTGKRTGKGVRALAPTPPAPPQVLAEHHRWGGSLPTCPGARCSHTCCQILISGLLSLSA